MQGRCKTASALLSQKVCFIMKKMCFFQGLKQFHTLREKAARADVEKLVGSMFVHAGIKTLVQPESRFFDPEAQEKNNHLTPFAVRTKQIRHCYEKLGIKKLYLHLDGSIPILKSKLQLTGYFTKALRCNGFQV